MIHRSTTPDTLVDDGGSGDHSTDDNLHDDLEGSGSHNTFTETYADDEDFANQMIKVDVRCHAPNHDVTFEPPVVTKEVVTHYDPQEVRYKYIILVYSYF